MHEKSAYRRQREARPLLAACLGAALLLLPTALWPDTPRDQTDLDEVQAEFGEAFETIGTYSADQRDKALAATRKTLSNIDDRIDDFEDRIRDRWADMSEATRERSADALRVLRDRRNRMSEAFGALSQGSGSAWHDLMAGIRSGWDDLENAWDNAAAAITPDAATGE